MSISRISIDCITSSHYKTHRLQDSVCVIVAMHIVAYLTVINEITRSVSIIFIANISIAFNLFPYSIVVFEN